MLENEKYTSLLKDKWKYNEYYNIYLMNIKNIQYFDFK